MREKRGKPPGGYPFARLTRFTRKDCATSMNKLTNQARQILREKRGERSIRPLAPGVMVSWEGVDGELKGPAVIEGVFQVEGENWVWLAYAGQERLLNTTMIVKVHAGPA